MASQRERRVSGAGWSSKAIHCCRPRGHGVRLPGGIGDGSTGKAGGQTAIRHEDSLKAMGRTWRDDDLPRLESFAQGASRNTILNRTAFDAANSPFPK